jgi:hypothetical protein
MYINSVRATAFGPFRAQTLELAPGLNVVHGPNEAGKSSWFAATYAGLAGRRRARGRGTTVQAEFAKRHKPWAGSQWRAAVTVTLDSGLVLAIEHDLRQGESRILDASSRRPIPLADLERRLGIGLTTEATLDGTRLLGLNRDSARATIFTGQADILRVLADARELQELLERAATTAGADATADGALTWLAARRSEWVGSVSVGAKPLRARRTALEGVRDVTSQRRDDLIRLVEAIAERHRIEILLRQARADLELADRVLRWQEVHELRGRIDQAIELSAKLTASAGAGLAVDEENLRAATAILGAFETGSDVVPLPPGPSATDLQAEIDALPERPDGDLEPRPEVEAAHRELSRAQTALTTLMNDPSDDPEPVQTQMSSDELRALADVIDAPPPVVDPTLSAQLASLQREAEQAAVAYTRGQAVFEAATRRDDETLRAHAVAVQEHARGLAEFERVRAERTTQYESLRQEAEEASRADAIAQAAYVSATRRNDEKLREHAVAVQDHDRALAEFERVRAERAARYESLRQEAERAAVLYTSAQAAYEAASRRNDEKLCAHAVAVEDHDRALAEFGRVRARRTARYESLRQEAEEASRVYAIAQAAYESATRRNDDKLRAHAEAVEEHTRALAEYDNVHAARTPRLEAVRKRSTYLLLSGVALLVVGIGIAVGGPVVVGILTTILGGVLAVFGILAGRAPSGPLRRTDEPNLPLTAPAPPAPPRLENVQAPVAPPPDPGLMEVQVELTAQPPAPPVPPRLEEVQAPVAPAPDPGLMEVQVELTAQPPAPPVPPRLEEVQAPVAPAPDPKLIEVQAEIKAHENAVRQHEEQVASARARMLTETLGPDPAALRRLARAIDGAEAAQERRRVHIERAMALRSTRDTAAGALAKALGHTIGAEVTDDVVADEFRAFDVYVAACHERADTARLASRRPDLVAAQNQRRQLELAHATAVAERDGQGRAVRELATGLGLGAPSSADEAAEELRGWRRVQEEEREAQAHRRELAARIDQLLDGRELAEWQAELARLMESAGPEPELKHADVGQFRADAARRHEAVVGRAGQLEGLQQQLSQALGSVAGAVEQEGDAARALAQVETLAACVDAAMAELNLAKDRAHASIAPALEARMRPWLARITNGRYLDVAVEPSNLSMKVTEASGAVRQAELLSHGTTEQLFLLLRVTLSQVLSASTETAPLILDEVTNQSDSGRKVAIMELLHEFSTARQVVLFTQEQEIVAWAEINLDNSRDKLIALAQAG